MLHLDINLARGRYTHFNGLLEKLLLPFKLSPKFFHFKIQFPNLNFLFVNHCLRRLEPALHAELGIVVLERVFANVQPSISVRILFKALSVEVLLELK